MIVLLLSVLALVVAEPPISDGYEHAHRHYLPPDFSEAARSQSIFNEAANELSQEYGAPSFRDISQYSAPSTRNPSSIYGAPSTRNIPNQYTAPTVFAQDYTRSGISQVHGEPGKTPSEIYGAPQRSYQDRTSSRHSVQKYGVPRFGNQSPVQGLLSSQRMDAFKSLNQFNTRSSETYTPKSLSTEYGAPGVTAEPYPQGLSRSVSSVYGPPNVRTPSGEYGTPEARSIDKTNAVASSYSARSQEDYGVASSDQGSGLGYTYSRSALEELLNQEPANYEFGYKVNDYTSGSDFGHAETRQAERAEGSYFVVLPDGTKQVVEYEADERGFKPRISVEVAESGPY